MFRRKFLDRALGTMMMRRYLPPFLPAFLLVGATALVTALCCAPAHAAGPSAMDDIAAQVRIQGFACDKPLRATRDKRRSLPDHQVWTLKCSNATYRFSRYADMAAKIEVLQ
jgi:hypothetical protein